MNVYQVIKPSCSISYSNNGGNDIGIALYEGDYVFVKHDSFWSKRASYLKFEKVDVLLKIYYNKMIDLDGNKEWTWIDNINLISPKINKEFSIRDVTSLTSIWGSPILKDVTVQWEREQKLNQIL